MILKVGVVVLLLAIDAVFAEQRLPEVLRVNLASNLERIPHLHRGFPRVHYAPVESLLSSKLHRSLDSTKVTCAWDSKHRECSISISSQKYLLEKSETEYAKMLVERMTCLEKTNATACRSVGPCYWNVVDWACVYKDMRRNHEDSPCAKVAPLYFNWRDARTQCRKQDSIERCNSNRLCQWSSDYQYCSYDEYLIFYGIKNFEDKLEQAADSVSDHLKNEYVAPQSGNDFTWQSILNYKPKSLECPSDIEQLVCDYVGVSKANVMGMEYYCSKKYGSDASKCEADVLCEWRSTKCETNGHSEYLAQKIAALRVLIPSMPEGTDKKIREAEYTCATIVEGRECRGKCMWNPIIGSCTARKDYIAALLTEPGTNATDALCTYLKTNGFSHCHTYFSKRKCERDIVCRMMAYSGCEPKEESYLSAAAAEDPRLEREYKIFKQECSNHTTKKACVEPSKVY